MARDRANINTNIWTDTHYRTLNRDQQWLYELLLTHPELSYAGVTDWRPGRLAQFAAGTSKQDIERIGAQLQAEKFIFIDEETEEVLIRSFTRHDGLLKQPKLTISMVNAYGAIASNSIREVFVHELSRLFKETPSVKAFENEKVLALLKLPARSMDAFTLGFTPELTLPFTPDVTPRFTPNAAQAQALPTSTTTSTTTSSNEEEKITPANRKTPCPPNFPITEAMASWARENNIAADLNDQTSRFLDHHGSKGTKFVDWTRAWQNWMRNSKEWAKPQADPNAIVPNGYAWANR